MHSYYKCYTDKPWLRWYSYLACLWEHQTLDWCCQVDSHSEYLQLIEGYLHSDLYQGSKKIDQVLLISGQFGSIMLCTWKDCIFFFSLAIFKIFSLLVGFSRFTSMCPHVISFVIILLSVHSTFLICYNIFFYQFWTPLSQYIFKSSNIISILFSLSPSGPQIHVCKTFPLYTICYLHICFCIFHLFSPQIIAWIFCSYPSSRSLILSISHI